MKYLFAIIVVFSFLPCRAQMPYEQMQRWTKAISKVCFAADGLVYNDGHNEIKLGFTEANFEVLFSTGKASYCVYKKPGFTEFMYLTEHINMADITDIYPMGFSGSAGVIRVTFAHPLTTQVFDKGAVINTTSQNYLDFFYKKALTDNVGDESYMVMHLLNDMAAKFKQQDNLPFNKFLLMAIKRTTDKTYLQENIALLKKLKYAKVYVWEGTNQEYIDKDYESAKQSFQKAYDLGDPDGLLNLGQMVWFGKGTESDSQTGKDMVRKAANLGSAEAYLQLSSIAENHRVDLPDAVAYIEKAISIGLDEPISRQTAYDKLVSDRHTLGEDYKNGPLLTSDEIYERMDDGSILICKSDYLEAVGKCVEALTLLIYTYESPYSRERTKWIAKTFLNTIYITGCDGIDKNNRVKKDKNMAKRFSSN
jgi:tetratricopeptide (TPR) repeat protein